MKEQKFLHFTKQYQALVFTICNSIVLNLEDAYDLSQEVFIKAWLKDEFFLEDFHQKAWLIKVARNLSLNFKRDWKRSLLKLLDFGSYQRSFTEFESDLERKDDLLVITKALSHLNLLDRQVVSLKYFADFSYMEIAMELNLPKGTVMSKLSRIKEKLLKDLSGEFYVR